MTGTGHHIFDPAGERFGRWTFGVILAVALHAGIAFASVLAWPHDETPVTVDGAILVELAPLPVAAEADAADVAPAEPIETAAITPPVETQAPPQPVEDPAPLAPAPEVTLPPEPIRDPQPVTETKPEPESEPEPAEAAPPPVAAAAPQVSAPPVPEAAPAPVTAAPKAGLSPAAEIAKASWQGKLATHVNKQQRYPAEARRKRIEGEAKIGFTIGRDGKVARARIVKSSGSPLLDRAAIQMIERASPLPIPPAEIDGATFDLVLPVKFKVR